MTAANGLKQLIQALNRTGTRYLIGGSLASSARGIQRSTFDVDIVVALQADQVANFCSLLGENWYADAETITEAIHRGRSFNLIFIPRSFKFDLFPATSAFHQAQLERATPLEIILENEPILCLVSTAEDIVLAKLQWLKKLGGNSERQESDIRGVLSSSEELNWEYIENWASKLGVTDLLNRLVD